MRRLKAVIFSLITTFSMSLNAQFSDSFDLEFGNQGIHIKTFETDFTPIQMAVLSNDEVLVLGRANYGDDYFTIVKFDANGQNMVASYGLYNGFSQYGSSYGGVTHNVRVTDMAALADGSAIIVGTSFNITTSRNELFAMKINPQGTKDTQFGTNGITTIGILNFNNDPIHARSSDMAIGNNGEIFIAGAIASSQIVVAKLLSNGQLDATFGDNGIVKQDNPFRPEGDRVEVELFSDGRVCVASVSETYLNGFQFPDLSPVFYAYLPNGDLDPNFLQGVRMLSRNIDLGNGLEITVDYEDFFPGELRINSNDIAFFSGAARDDDEVTIDFGAYLISILPNGQYNTNIAVDALNDTLVTEERISVPGMISLATAKDEYDYVLSLQLLDNGHMLLLGSEESMTGTYSVVKYVDETGNPIVSYANNSVFRYRNVLNNYNEGFLVSGFQSNGELVAVSQYTNETGRKGMFLGRIGVTGVLGLAENEEDLNTFKLFPNPSRSVVYISHPKGKTVDNVTVFDISGKVINATLNTNEIDVSNLSQGVYLVEIQSEGLIQHGKIIRK